MAYNSKDQATTIDGVANTYADVDQTERTTAGGRSISRWIVGDVADTVGGVTRYYIRTPSGELIATRSVGVSHYYIHDGEKNVIGLTNASGSRTATYGFDPYGRETVKTGTDAAINRYRYKEGWLNDFKPTDADNLYKFGTRSYDPKVQRWTQQDPVGSTNRYEYVGGNPIDNWDPSGRWLDGIAAAAGVVGAGVGVAALFVTLPVWVGPVAAVAGVAGAGYGVYRLFGDEPW